MKYLKLYEDYKPYPDFNITAHPEDMAILPHKGDTFYYKMYNEIEPVRPKIKKKKRIK